MPFSKVEPFLAKISSKKLDSVFNPWKVLLMIILGCLLVALIVGVVLIIIFLAGINLLFLKYLIDHQSIRKLTSISSMSV